MKTPYSHSVAEAICRRMSEGESLRQICRDPTMPNFRTVTRWAKSKPHFQAKYTEARTALLEFWAEQITDIADDASNDWMEREEAAGRTKRFNDEHVQRSRLRIDARKWLLSKLLPKKYGERLDLTHAGPEGAPIAVVASISADDAAEAYFKLIGGKD